MKITAAFLFIAIPCPAQWVMTTSTNPSVRAVAPEAHSVRSDERFTYVESAGLSLHSFGPLEANQYDAAAGPRTLAFQFPRLPKPAVLHAHTPLGITGVFVTGVPLYNPIGVVSYQNQNIWHYDAVAQAAGRSSSLLSSLAAASGRHSPVIGFALDGYPIYGPFGWDAAGNVKRMESGYRLRPISRRDTLPDGTLLTPAQEGPNPAPEFPSGTFAEDYEYSPAPGDLDEFNGRFAKTPDYPQGRYAYFLATTNTGALAWPYLIGPRYYGEADFEVPARRRLYRSQHVDLWTDCAAPEAGQPVQLTLLFRDAAGRPVRFLEKVHEQPVHLIVVSEDLNDFHHIHPEPVPGNAFAVTHTFEHAGKYRLYADYTAPGQAASIVRFSVNVTGVARKPRALLPDTEHTKTAGGIRVIFTAPPVMKAGEDLPLSFTLRHADNDQPVSDLEPWLGAWGHVMIVSADGETFIHAHPIESLGTVHSHATMPGPRPATIRTVTGFRSPGLYKIWLQFQRHGELITIPWVVKVSAPDKQPGDATAVPAGALRVKISAAGFEPARLQLPSGKAAEIAFTRSDAQNCAGEVVFPELGLRKQLPPGQTVVVSLPALPAGELRFACGMGMFRGAVVVQN